MEARFWSKVRRDADDECWEWLGWKSRDGYGMFDVAGKKVKAHRLSWELAYDAIPDGLVVRHKCRGKCVNPNHLELGSVLENHRDMIRDGTDPRWERNPAAKLTNEQVLEIKTRLRDYYHGLQRQLAKEYGVHEVVISAIKKGKSWVGLLDKRDK
jgi:hypothetical protein